MSQNADPVNHGMGRAEAFLWFLFCLPVGYIKLGQGLKCIVWLLVSAATAGIGFIPMVVDYFMCNNKASKTGTLGTWEFFPVAK